MISNYAIDDSFTNDVTYKIIDTEKNQEPITLDFKTFNIENITVTVYHPVKWQTDNTPNIVASGKKFDVNRASDYKWLAISRDLHVRWGGMLDFGDLVFLDNAGKLTGWYYVEDTMNARFTKRVDVLMTPGSPLEKYTNASLKLITDI